MTQLAVQQNGHPSPAVRGAHLDLRTIRPDSPITIECGDGFITMSVQNVIDWVAPGAPVQDAMRFLMVCRNVRLNPLLGEILLLKMGKAEEKYQVVIPKSGLLKRAQENPDYDGHESGITVWYQGEFRDLEGMIRPQIADCPVVGGWAKVHKRSISRPIYKRVSLEEYRKQTYIWGGIPNTMICKVALAAALREAFNLSDTYDDAELPYDLPETKVTTAPEVVNVQAEIVQPPSKERADKAIAALEAAIKAEPAPDVHVTNYRTNDTVGWVKPELVKTIDDLAEAVGMSDESYVQMLVRRGVDDLQHLTVAQAEEIIARLESVLRERDATSVFGPPAETVVLPDVARNDRKNKGDEAAPEEVSLSPVVQISDQTA